MEDHERRLVIRALEDEKLRRILQRVAEGTAAFDGKLIFSGTDSEGAADGLKPTRRENGIDIFPGPALASPQTVRQSSCLSGGS
jgi:hypothetical protein